MPASAVFSERLRIVLASALVLLIVQSANAQSSANLQSLVNDTAVQFKLAYRHNATEHRRRHQQLVETITAWRAARRNDVNNRMLAGWLRGAIRNSMPGSRDPLPPMPKFQPAAAAINSTAAQSPPAAVLSPDRDALSRPDRTPAPGMDKSTGDPFGDDAF